MDKFDNEKTKQRLKITGWILIFSNLAAYLAGRLLGVNAMLTILCAIPLVSYAIYIKYYPYIYIEKVPEKDQDDFFTMPCVGPAIALILTIFTSDSYNYDFGDSIKITICITVILVIPFIVKSAKTAVHQKLGHKILVIIVTFVIAYAITIPVNILLTFGPEVHQFTIIADKDKDDGGNGTDYYLYVQWNGKKEEFSVSKNEYYETDIGDPGIICIKKSILGLEYYTIHI